MNEDRKTDNFAVLASRDIDRPPTLRRDLAAYQVGGAPASQRLASTIELAQHINAIARDLGEALCGTNPPEKPVPVQRAGVTPKGLIASIEVQAAEIELALENAKAALEAMRRMV